MNTKSREQCFLHLATYRLDDLRATDLGPDVLEVKITPALAETISTRLATVCEQQGWTVINIATHPDHIEALLTGLEPAGETGESVATALDGAVYGGTVRAAAMN